MKKNIKQKNLCYLPIIIFDGFDSLPAVIFMYYNASAGNILLTSVFFCVCVCRVNDDGFAPLDVAAMLGALPIVKMLLLYGAQESSKCKCMVF